MRIIVHKNERGAEGKVFIFFTSIDHACGYSKHFIRSIEERYS